MSDETISPPPPTPLLPSTTAALLERWRRLVRSARLDGWSGLTLGPLLLAVPLLAAIWCSHLLYAERERQLAVDNALQDNANIARVAVSVLEQTLERSRRHARLARAGLDDPRLLESLRLATSGDGIFTAVMVQDPLRGPLFSSSPTEADTTSLLRMGTRLSSDAPRSILADEIALFPAERGPDGNWRLPISIPLMSVLGNRGQLLALIDANRLLQPFRTLDLGSGGALRIYDASGHTLFDTRSGEGRFTPTDDTNSRRLAAALHGRSTVDRADGRPALLAFERSASNGLGIAVERRLDEVLHSAAQRRLALAGWAWSLSLVLVAALAAMVLVARRQHRLYRELTRAEDEKERLIEQLKEEKGRAYQLASHDHLTSLPNRMLFTELAVSHLNRARRNHAPFVMMFLDLDRFKAINDTLGHRVGDLLLREVADRLKASVRDTDIVARLGGDEFVVLLTELDAADAAARVARKLIEALARPMKFDEHELEVRASVGIAIHPRDGQDIDALMRNADSAMYEAKRSGRGCFRYYDPSLNARSALHLDLHSRFRRAILGEEFVLHYQPRVALNGLRITSLEALIRWQHPERGLVYPGDFIDYAEQEGLVVELGNWVVREACRQIAAWQQEGITVVPVAINVSARQLRDQSFVEVIRETTAHYGIRPDMLELEITERCVVDDFERAHAALEVLSKLGLKIALDDFGTGFSSLSYLRRLPIDIIKIDRSFINDIRNQTNDAAIVASTIALGHNLGLTVIAEGVETREQAVYLKAAGCDEVQGYYFQRPIPAADTLPLLVNGIPDR